MTDDHGDWTHIRDLLSKYCHAIDAMWRFAERRIETQWRVGDTEIIR